MNYLSRLFNSDNKLFKSITVGLVFNLTITLLIFIGYMMIIEAGSFTAKYKFENENYFIFKQAKLMVISFLLFLLGSKISYKVYNKSVIVYSGFVLSIILCLYLILFSSGGDSIKGATRWVAGFQPSELSRVAIILFLSYSLTKKQPFIRSLKAFIPNLVFLGVIVILVLLQPAFSTSMMIAITGFAMIYLANSKALYMAIILLLVSVMSFFVVTKVSYRFKRIESYIGYIFYDKEPSWQVKQSLRSFGNGGFSGIGYGESRQKEFYLPEPYNDFIYAIVGDEFGFLGTSFLVGLYLIVIICGFKIAAMSGDFFGFILASGITVSFATLTITHMAINLGLFPPTGQPLPLISYGGTALAINMFMLGILNNIYFTGKKNKIIGRNL